MSEERTEDLLSSAAMWGDLTLLESLLENGADPNLPNTQGNPPLHVASYYGELECASVLLSYKGESGSGGKQSLLLAPLSPQESPTHHHVPLMKGLVYSKALPVVGQSS